jgi:hypothetical protein
MPIAILEHGLGPILLAISAPQPALEQGAIAWPERFDLAGLGQGRSGKFPTHVSPRGKQHGRFPSELPMIRTDEALAPSLISWNPSRTSLLRIDPAKVRYRLQF